MVLQDISVILLTKLLVNQITYYMKYYEPNLTLHIKLQCDRSTHHIWL